MGKQTTEGDSPVLENGVSPAGILSTTGHEESCGKQGRPLSKAKYIWRPIVDKYREGKVKRTAVSGVKENLKLCAYNQSEGEWP